ncbi:uncharacterized protein LOC106055992 [Biomphalaria glabrata]|uniref:Uncharacterized protein LOC106055992 n=1 Tax=Biomphalaria glabrata TaxID=6526 RepID=A0A9W2ZES5_BIOGL|nr:uncharacterized protein LOC106055992 [Biomphalaria glabrata]
MLNVTDMENKTTSRYNSTRKPTMYEFHPGTFIIHSTSALQVVVIFKRNGTFERSSCSILPSNLFMTEYLAKLPNEFSEHAIIIIAVGSLQDYVLNNMTLNTFRTLQEISSYMKLRLLQIDLDPNVDSPFSLRTLSGQAFGCYMFGLGEGSTYATPIAFGNTSVDFDYSEDPSTATISPATTARPTPPTTTATWCTPSPQNDGDGEDNDCDGYVDEEVPNKKDDDKDGLTDEDNSVLTENGCLPGWYGTFCDVLCRCENNECLTSGDCKENVRCLPGFFGQQCQYKDLVMTSTVSQEEMKFRSATKCQQNFTASSPLIIRFPDLTRISWIKIEAVSKDSLKGLQVMYESTSKLCYAGRCLERRDILLGTDTLIISCNIPGYICQINISFSELNNSRQWCAVYVGAGRNLALGKNVSMSSNSKDKNGVISRGSLSVDGDTDSAEKKCSTTDIKDKKPVWRVTFPSPVVVFEVVIQFRASFNETFIVQLLDCKDQVISTFSGITEPRVSFIHRTRHGQYTQSVEITLNNSNSALSICEFEAYGDCAPPVYGPDCTDICSISCLDQMCTYEGYCYHCANGTGGPYCFDGCLEWCVEYEEATNATTSTTKVTYAPHRQTGFRVENFWFYFMVLLFLLCVCCCGCKGSDKRQDQVLLQRWKENETLLLKETPVFKSSTSVDVVQTRRSLCSSSLFMSSTPVDVSEVKESISVKSSRSTDYR